MPTLHLTQQAHLRSTAVIVKVAFMLLVIMRAGCMLFTMIKDVQCSWDTTHVVSSGCKEGWVTRMAFLSLMGNKFPRVDDFAKACGSCCSSMEQQVPGYRGLHRLYTNAANVSCASQTFPMSCQKRNVTIHGDAWRSMGNLLDFWLVDASKRKALTYIMTFLSKKKKNRKCLKDFIKVYFDAISLTYH